MDEAVDIFFADTLALGSGATVGIDLVPPGAALVVTQGLADHFAPGAALFLRSTGRARACPAEVLRKAFSCYSLRYCVAGLGKTKHD